MRCNRLQQLLTQPLPRQQTPRSEGEEARRARDADRTSGTVASIDKTAMTITIKGKSKEEETLNITSKTHIFADGKPAILADAKEGENVVAEYTRTKKKRRKHWRCGLAALALLKPKPIRARQNRLRNRRKPSRRKRVRRKRKKRQPPTPPLRLLVRLKRR